MFSNSLASAGESTASSSRVIEAVQQVVNAFTSSGNTPPAVKSSFIRKATHFCEYMLLGFFVPATYFSFATGDKKKLRLILTFGAVTVAWPIVDEILQIFSPGRACSVLDMLLDMGGELTGGLFAVAFFTFAAKFFEGKKPNPDARVTKRECLT